MKLYDGLMWVLTVIIVMIVAVLWAFLVILTFAPSVPLMLVAMPAFLTGKCRALARPYLVYHRLVVKGIFRTDVPEHWRQWAHYER